MKMISSGARDLSTHVAANPGMELGSEQSRAKRDIKGGQGTSIAGDTQRLPILAAAVVLTFHAAAVRAQHASDNPVASAEDAFGLTLGLESIGMYSPGQVRGFSPQTAGNVRIGGLYFDQQGALSNRVIEGSTIRVGVSEIGYAFPAPTGIVDYELRHPGDGASSATIIANAGPYEGRGISIDGTLPLAGKELLLPIGVGAQVSTGTPYGPYPGYTSTVMSAGATPQWSPNDKVTVRALFDWQETKDAKTFPLFFTAGDFLPPPISRGYLGQDWAQGRGLTENLGVLLAAQLSRAWSLTAGLFRSTADNPLSFADLYTAIQADGRSEHLIVGYPDQSAASTSGEVRLTGRFRAGDWHHELILLARGRDILSRYGGDDAVDVGPAIIGTGLQIPEPTFRYSPRTTDRTKLWSIGSAYHVDWRGFAELEMGIQTESYRKTVASPGASAGEVRDQPARAYGNSALALTRRLTLYAGYTQGLEDSGVAPSAAQNRGAVLPASQTWQLDAGVRYLVTPQLKVIAGVYELQKPYFNLDAGGIDRDLGIQRARGVELSISGQQIAHFDINAGILAAKVSILGPDLAAEGVGPVAIGQPRLQYVANVNYTVPWWSVLSLDLAAIHFGSEPASVNNGLYSPAVTLLNLGGRYKFSVFGKRSTLRVEVQNVGDSYWWTNVYTPGLFQWPGPRTVFAYVTTDL
jgi:iron complex outermembrane receptor protein